MPKNQKGGYQVLDLTGIDLELTSEAVNITDAGALEQLKTLKGYIDSAYNYAKPLKRKLKPILLSLRDKKSDEKQESSAWANLSVYDDALSYKIESVIDANPLKVLQIKVTFELKEDDTGATYYDIKTAKVLLTNTIAIPDGSISGDLSVGDDLTVTGDASVGGDLTVTDDTSIGGDLEVNGDVKIALDKKYYIGSNEVHGKPIYCHPILIKQEPDANNRSKLLTCLIFNNDSTPFTRQSFKQFLDDLCEATNGLGKIMVSGGFTNSTNYYVASYITKEVIGEEQYSYRIYGMLTSTGVFGNQSNAVFDAWFGDTTTIEDGVNLIN